METKVLYWQKTKYFSYAIQVIISGYLLAGQLKEINLSKDGIHFISLIFTLFFVLALIKGLYDLIKRMIIPELEFSDVSLKFFINSKKDKKRISLPVYNIGSISECRKMVPKSGRFENTTLYVIKTKSGEEYEYSPNEKSEKRVNEIRAFLTYYPWVPAIISSNAEIKG